MGSIATTFDVLVSNPHPSVPPDAEQILQKFSSEQAISFRIAPVSAAETRSESVPAQGRPTDPLSTNGKSFYRALHSSAFLRQPQEGVALTPRLRFAIYDLISSGQREDLDTIRGAIAEPEAHRILKLF